MILSYSSQLSSVLPYILLTTVISITFVDLFKFNSKFNFLLKISNKFFKKMNSSIFIQTISKLKFLFEFAKKKATLTRNFIFKYK